MKIQLHAAALLLSWTSTLSLSAAQVQFDRDRYDIDPGETFAASVVLHSSPAPVLTSFGVELFLSPTNAVVTNASAIRVPAALNHDGVRGPGAVRVVAPGRASAKGTVDFFVGRMTPYAGQSLATYQITDLGAGSHTLSLGFFNTLGPSEEIFVDGNGVVLDQVLTFGTALVNYRPTVRLLTPTNGASFLLPATIQIMANATDQDGTVAKVEFFSGVNKLGESTGSPYAFAWTNAEPGAHELAAVATDNHGATATSGTVTITVRSNTTPMLAAIPDQVLDELTPLMLTVTATDAESPPQSLTFALAPGAPSGLLLNPQLSPPNSARLTWTPTEAQGPGTYPITVLVSDNGVPTLGASQSFRITVREINAPPALAPIADQSVFEGSPVIVTAVATDLDLPRQTLRFTLDTGAPPGAAIDPVSGVFTWIPSDAQGPSTNTLTVRVTDDGSPALSDTAALTVIVREETIQGEPYAIFAGEANRSKGAKVLNFSGNGHSISGKTHSNSDIDFSGNNHTFRNSLIEHVTGVRLPAGKVTFIDSQIVSSQVLPYPVDYTLADFAPGGSSATEAEAQGKYFHVAGNTRLDSFIENGVLREGLYYVEGDVHLTGSVRGRVTLVATGEIQFSGSGMILESYSRCLLAYSGESTARYNKAAVRISGSNLRWQGVIFAPGGSIDLTGSANAVSVGSIIGRGVKIAGSGLQLTGIDLVGCTPLVAPLTPVVAGNELLLSFSTVAGLGYAVEYCDSISAGRWQLLTTVTGDGATKLVRTPRASPQRFFRLRSQ